MNFNITETEKPVVQARSAREAFRLRYQTKENPRFSILELMAFTAIAAVCLTAITNTGIVGAAVIGLLCVLSHFFAKSKVTCPAKSRFYVQFTWGLLMPVACIFGDPLVFGTFNFGEATSLNEWAAASYAFIGWQVGVLICSWFVRPDQNKINSFVAGTLSAGAVFSFALAVLLTPFAVIGLIVLIGALGFVPWATAFVYISTAQMHWNRAQDNNEASLSLGIAGFTFAFALLAVVMKFAIDFEWSFGSQDWTL